MPRPCLWIQLKEGHALARWTKSGHDTPGKKTVFRATKWRFCNEKPCIYIYIYIYIYIFIYLYHGYIIIYTYRPLSCGLSTFKNFKFEGWGIFGSSFQCCYLSCFVSQKNGNCWCFFLGGGGKLSSQPGLRWGTSQNARRAWLDSGPDPTFLQPSQKQSPAG